MSTIIEIMLAVRERNPVYYEYLNGVTFQKIEVILEKFKTMLTETAIVDYNKAA